MAGPRLRRLALGLATVLGLGQGGYFIPCRYAAAGRRPRADGPYAVFEQWLDGFHADFAARLAALDEFSTAFAGFGTKPPPEPRWTQDWLPRLDGALAYAMVRWFKPRRIVEVGSGHSTRFMVRAIRDGALQTRFTAIDPAPRADIAALPIEHRRQTLQQAGLAPFAALAAGDILFIDSSHVAMPGSDVDILFGRVLPLLPAGVLIQIHDLPLPDDYPPEWDWRGYNELQLVAALLAGGGFTPLFASHYVKTRMATELAASAAGSLPLLPGAHESSLWLRKTCPALGVFGSTPDMDEIPVTVPEYGGAGRPERV